MLLTPVAVFLYNRPAHTERLLTSLALCRRLDECVVTLFCDAAKGPSDRGAVDSVQEIAKSWTARHGGTVIKRARNLGLAESIVGGVTKLCEEYGRIIVLEDDLVVNSRFLEYMLNALSLYEHESAVLQVSGFMFPVHIAAAEDAVFLRLATTWGWGTWKRAWDQFPPTTAQCTALLSDRKTRKEFDIGGTYPYSKMLRQRLAGSNQSWGILWWVTVYSAGGLVLHPCESLVWNGGFDSSGTHRGSSSTIVPDLQAVLSSRREPLRLPVQLTVNRAMENGIQRLFRHTYPHQGLLRSLIRRVYRWGTA